MSKKIDHNPKLIFAVKGVRVEGAMVYAAGEAGTNATSPRLVRSRLQPDPETLALDFEADDGLLQVITPVEATYDIEHPHPYARVTVHVRSGSITQELPRGEGELPRGERELGPGEVTYIVQWYPNGDFNRIIIATATHRRIGQKASPGETVRFEYSGPGNKQVKINPYDCCHVLFEGQQNANVALGVGHTIAYHGNSSFTFTLVDAGTVSGPHAPGDGTIDVGGGGLGGS